MFNKSLHLSAGRPDGWLVGSQALRGYLRCQVWLVKHQASLTGVLGRKILGAVYWKHFKGWGLHDFSQQQGAPQVAGGLLMTRQTSRGSLLASL